MKQRPLRDVADAYPDDGRAARPKRPHRDEVLILRNDNRPVRGGAIPDFAVARVHHSEFRDMRGLVPEGNKMTRESGRQLGVDQKSHLQAGRMTG